MNIYDHLNAEPMKYWSPPKGSTLVQDILDNPEKYSQYLFTPKLDGEWNKLVWDGSEVWMLSRNRNVQGEFTNRADKVPHLVNEIMNVFPPNTVLLGELNFLKDAKKTSKDVGSIMRSLPPKAIQKQKESPLYFTVFDRLMWDGQDLSNLSYEERFPSNLTADGAEFIHFMSPKEITELETFLQEFFRIGGEGAVLIDRNSAYAFGKRPARASIKIKKQLNDFEAKVIDVLDPNREYKGTELENWPYWEEAHIPTGTAKLCGSLHKRSMEYSYTPVTKPYYYGWKNAIRCEYQGRIFDVASGLNDSDREWLATSEARAAIDEGTLYAVIGAMEFTETSVRHPFVVRLRTDI